MRPILPLLAALVVLTGAVFPAAGCTLADHAWQPIVFQAWDLDRPVVLQGILSWLVRSVPGQPREVWFRTNHPGEWWAADALKASIGGWVAQAAWHPIGPESGLLERVRTLAAGDGAPVALVAGVDQVRVWAGVFRDANAADGCYQFLVAQEARVRAILTGPVSPWAEEKTLRCWASAVFYGPPVPAGLLALTVTLDGETPAVTIDDPAKVALLISGKRLKQFVPKPGGTAPALSEIPPVPGGEAAR
ncbi:MAG: hypothetical protein GX442_14095 [Candidatus Riflebacteria bacterium]|nr:hypothetical protein [Candidatus Riflebacteria bacterium]